MTQNTPRVARVYASRRSPIVGGRAAWLRLRADRVRLPAWGSWTCNQRPRGCWGVRLGAGLVAILAVTLLPACTTVYADRVVLLSPQTYLRAQRVDAEGVAFLTSSLTFNGSTHAIYHQHQEIHHHEAPR